MEHYKINGNLVISENVFRTEPGENTFSKPRKRKPDMALWIAGLILEKLRDSLRKYTPKGYLLISATDPSSNGPGFFQGHQAAVRPGQGHPRRRLGRSIAGDVERALRRAKLQTKGTGTKRGLTRTHLGVFGARIDLGEGRSACNGGRELPYSAR